MVKALLQQELSAQSSAQTCQLLKSTLCGAAASHQTGFSWSKAFETSRCKGEWLYAWLYTLHRLLQQRGLLLCDSSLLLRMGTLRSQKSPLFDAAVEGTISGFMALFLNKTEPNIIKIVSDI